MANLETLELTISANAESASQGIRSLSRSLSSLSRSIAKHIGNIEQLATALQNIKTAATGLNVGSALKGYSSSSGGKKATKTATAATTPMAPWGYTHPQYRMPPYKNSYDHGGGLYNWNGARLKQWNFQAGSAGAFTPIGANHQYYYPVGQAPVSKEVQQMDEMLKRNGGLADVKGKASEVIGSFKQIGDTAEETGKKTSKAFGRIAKIASTMLLRTALRSIMKAFGESWEAMYKYSNAMGGDFAKSIDALKASLQGAATSILSAFTPALVALTPVIQVVASAIRYLCQGIQWLMSLLGMSTEFLGASTDAINKYTGASGGAGKANKEMLASFDELNVISSQSGGGGGGGSGIKTGLFSDQISEELAAISLIVSESLLAVGLILAFTGHPVIGTALMAVGAAGLVQAVVSGWNMSDQIKQEMAKIMSIFAGAELALGIILACTGHLGLGIGLIALGAANLVGSIAISWGLEGRITSIIQNLDTVVGGAALAIGALLLFTGASIGMGLGLFAYGALKITSELGEQWGIDDKIMGIINTIKGALDIATLTIGAILLFSGANIPLGLGLLAVGAVGMAAEIAPNWGTIKQNVIQTAFSVSLYLIAVFNNVKQAILNAWDAVSTWTNNNIIEPIKGAWEQVRSFFIRLFGSSAVVGSIAWWANVAWKKISEWWGNNIGSPLEAAWENFTSFFETLFGGAEVDGSIAHWASTAWSSVAEWWGENIGAPIETAWANVTDFFITLFGGKDTSGSIASMAYDAWLSVSEWWDSKISKPVSDAWDSVTTFFSTLFGDKDTDGSIAHLADTAWQVVGMWWDSAIAKPVEDAWNSITEFFSTLFGTTEQPGSIACWANNAWNSVSEWWTTDVLGSVKAAWDTVSEFFSTMWTGLQKTVYNAWNTAKNWWKENFLKKISGAWEGVKGFFSELFYPIEVAWSFLQQIMGIGTITINFKINGIVDSAVSAVLKLLAGGNEAKGQTYGLTWELVRTAFGFASGGFPVDGQLFLAGEQGAELVGSMNGHTAVANGDQIVEGIASGVRQAEEEQNELLRQQNSLLRQILQKGSSMPGASVALGRTVKQSLEMYGMVGG